MSEREESVVFLIDDDPSVRKAVVRLLRSAGFDCRAFDSAQAFLDGEIPDRPACLVLDVRMPGLSGLELQEALQRERPDLPIVFITGHGDVPMSVRAMKAGAVDFLEKPFEDDVLFQAVRQAIERHRTRREGLEQQRTIRRRLERLTPREREVMELVISGLLNKQIGGRLGASEKTIKVHRGRMMRKMRAGSVAELVHMTQKVGIVGR